MDILSQPRAQCPRKVTHGDAREKLIETFIATALPGGAACLGRDYHLLHRRLFRAPPGERRFLPPSCFGMPPLLDREAVAMHLRGSIVIAPRFPELVDYAEVDIDAKDDASRASLLDRFAAVTAALDARPRPLPRPHDVTGNLVRWPDIPPDRFERPGIAWRSSPARLGGGLRYRLVFDRLHPRDELRERVLVALAASGIEERGGDVEVWPNGDRGARAPLGWGSVLVDADGRPLADLDADVDDPACCMIVGQRFRTSKHGPSRVVRDVAAFVAAWARLVSARRVPLERVLRVATVVSVPSEVVPLSERKEGGAGSRPAARGSRWRERIADLLENGAPEGGLNAACPDVVFELRRHHDSAEALRRFIEWLETAPHGSNGLNGPRRAEVRAQRIRSARRQLARLDQTGMKRHGGPRRPTHPLLAHPVPPSSLSDSGTTRRAAIAAALAELSDADRAWVERGESNAKWRERLGLLLVALRRVQRDDPSATGAAVPRSVLKAIATGNRWTDPSTGEVSACYLVLRDKAQALGVLGANLERFSKRRKTANIFALPRAVEFVAYGELIERARAALATLRRKGANVPA